MSAIDFTAALARLLSDAALRAALAANPADVTERLGVRGEDGAALAALPAEELECQARVLLRKRLEGVRHLLPQTCAALGENLWPHFLDYARAGCPRGQSLAAQDARGFAEHLAAARVPGLCRSELHRARFALGHARGAVHLARELPVGGGPRRALQVFLRGRSGSWREWAVFFRW